MVIGKLGRVQKTAGEMVRSGVWKHSVMRRKWKTYNGSTWTMDKKEHINSNAYMKTVVNEEDRESILLNSLSLMQY